MRVGDSRVRSFPGVQNTEADDHHGQQPGGGDLGTIGGDEEHADQCAADEHDYRPREPREQPHAKMQWITGSQQFLAQAELRDGDHQVDQQCYRARGREQEGEYVLGCEVVDEGCQDAQYGSGGNGGHRHLGTVGALEHPGCVTPLRRE